MNCAGQDCFPDPFCSYQELLGQLRVDLIYMGDYHRGLFLLFLRNSKDESIQQLEKRSLNLYTRETIFSAWVDSQVFRLSLVSYFCLGLQCHPSPRESPHCQICVIIWNNCWWKLANVYAKKSSTLDILGEFFFLSPAKPVKDSQVYSIFQASLMKPGLIGMKLLWWGMNDCCTTSEKPLNNFLILRMKCNKAEPLAKPIQSNATPKPLPVPVNQT